MQRDGLWSLDQFLLSTVSKTLGPPGVAPLGPHDHPVNEAWWIMQCFQWGRSRSMRSGLASGAWI